MQPSPHKDSNSPLRSTSTPFLSLPPHLLVSIFSCLDNQSIKQLRLVSRDCRDAANTALRHLKPSYFTKKLLDIFPKIQSLDLTSSTQSTSSSYSEDTLQHLSSQSINLTSIKLGRNNTLTSIGASHIAALHPSLLSLELLESTISNASLLKWTALTSLRTLHLRACVHINDESISKVLSCMKELTEVDLGGCYRVGNKTLAVLGQLPMLRKADLASCDRFGHKGVEGLSKSTSLTTLLLPACWQIDDTMLCTLSSGLTNLECLSLFEAGGDVTDIGLFYLSSLKHLTALDLGYSCWEHTDQGLCKLITSLPHLKMLNIAGAGGSNDSVMQCIGQLKHLTTLDISECQKITAQGMKYIADLPLLQELNAGWNLKLTDEALASLPRSITKLDLSYCGDLTDKALLHIAERLPCISTLVLRRCAGITDKGIHALCHGSNSSIINTANLSVDTSTTSPLLSSSQLQSLDVSHTSITSTGLKHLTSLTTLSSLSIAGCIRASTVIGLASLASIPSLTSLDMSHNQRLDDGCMQAISFARGLKHLALRNCSRVSDRGMMALVRLSQLSKLEVDGCRGITWCGVERVKRKLASLGDVRMSGVIEQQQQHNSGSSGGSGSSGRPVVPQVHPLHGGTGYPTMVYNTIEYNRQYNNHQQQYYADEGFHQYEQRGFVY